MTINISMQFTVEEFKKWEPTFAVSQLDEGLLSWRITAVKYLMEKSLIGRLSFLWSKTNLLTYICNSFQNREILQIAGSGRVSCFQFCLQMYLNVCFTDDY